MKLVHYSLAPLEQELSFMARFRSMPVMNRR